MVALLIITMTVVLGLGAVRQAVTTARLTKEVQTADILLRNILVDGPRSFTETRGQSAGFAWTLTTAVTGAERPIEVCRRHVLAVHQRSARRYETSTLETCPEASNP